jgi:hypothetical protein
VLVNGVSREVDQRWPIWAIDGPPSEPYHESVNLELIRIARLRGEELDDVEDGE